MRLKSGLVDITKLRYPSSHEWGRGTKRIVYKIKRKKEWWGICKFCGKKTLKCFAVTLLQNMLFWHKICCKKLSQNAITLIFFKINLSNIKMAMNISMSILKINLVGADRYTLNAIYKKTCCWLCRPSGSRHLIFEKSYS